MLHALLAADASLRAWIALGHAAWLDPIMIGLSAIGEGGTIWLLFGVLATVADSRRSGRLLQLGLVILLAYLVVDHGLKPLVARARPFDAYPDIRVIGWHPTTFSFPSGHAASAVAGAFVLALMVPRLVVPIWVLAAGIAFSRIYVGAHFPIDVAGGAVVGLAVALFVTGGRAGANASDAPAARSGPAPVS